MENSGKINLGPVYTRVNMHRIYIDPDYGEFTHINDIFLQARLI